MNMYTVVISAKGRGGNMVIPYMGGMRRYFFEQIGVWKSESSFKNR